MTFPLAQNITSITGMFRYTNNVTEGIGSSLLLLMMYASILMFLMFRENVRTIDAFVTTNTIIMIPTIFFRTLGLIPDKVFFSILVVFILSVAGLFMLNDEQG